VDREKKDEALKRNTSSLDMVTKLLRVIFFRLSNTIGNHSWNDKLVLPLLQAVSHSNPEIISTMLSDTCVSTETIKEAVYGCALRNRDYVLVLRLLQSGVHPDYKISCYVRTIYSFDHKKVPLYYDTPVSDFKSSGLEWATSELDLRLAKIMLDSGARIINGSDGLINLSMRKGFLPTYYDDQLEFVQLPV